MKRVTKPLNLSAFTPNQRKVIVAKDVLQQLKARRIIARRGIYLRPEVHDEAVLEQNTGKQLRDILPQMKPCDACALGSLFIGYVDKFNNMEIPRLTHRLGDDGNMRNLLSDTFQWSELEAIEYDFEGYGRDERSAQENKILSRSTPTAILRRICNFIVNTNGEVEYKKDDFVSAQAVR